MRKRGPKSKIEKLDPAIKAEIDRLLRDEGRTIDDVVEFLQTLKLDDSPSRGSVARYSASASKIRGDMDRLNSVTAQLSKEFGDQDNDVARFLVQIAQSIAFKVMDEKDGYGVQEFMYLMKGLKDMSAARKATLDAEEKILAKLKREAAKLFDQAQRDAQSAGEGKGLSAERLAQLRR
ncbi:phage protein Gp27 family protein, partial [Thalassobaculum litoreum]